MGMIKINLEVAAVDLALYIPKNKTLIFSDFHLGYEEALTSRGTLVPRFQFRDTIDRLEKIFALVGNVKKIVVNGDLKHEFGSISAQEWREVLKLLDYFAERCGKVVIVKGNHDAAIGAIARKRGIEIVKDCVIGSTLIVHGDKVIGTEKLEGIKTVIIGHEHPALGLRENKRFELFKCFLKGKWKGKALIVQPSFNLLQEGTDVLNGTFLSPYLKGADLRNFEVWAVAKPGETAYFGKIKNIRI